MLLGSSQQTEGTRAEPIVVALAQNLGSSY